MKRIFSFTVLLLFTINIAAQQLPSKAEIAAKLKLVNDYWIMQNTSPGNNQWARAVYFTGNMDFYKMYPKDIYLQYANLWATNNNWSLNGGISTRNADNQTCGQVYIDLYNMDSVKIPSKINAIKTSIDLMINSAKSDDWWWIDALYMAMPVFTRLGILTNDTSYFNKMYEIYYNNKVKRGLYNSTENLWYRDETYDPPYATRNGQDSYWSRGNGWVIAAHARVLQLLPVSDSHRAEYIETFQKMAYALKDRQRDDGFWNPSLDDPNEYNGPETSGTAFFTYSIAWGINNLMLDSATFYPVVVKAWNALTTTAVQANGFLGYVQGVGAGPAQALAGTTQDFGIGAFLLAGTELIKLTGGIMPLPSNFSIKAVNVIDNTHIKVSFTKKINPTTALLASNYNINNGISITEITKDVNDSAAILTISSLNNGSYLLKATNITSSDGWMIDNGESKTFVYTGLIIVKASGYEPGTSNTAEKTLDYDYGTRWSCEGKGQWIQYDLGEIKQVNAVDIAFFNGNARKGIFSIYLSTNETDTVQVFNGMSSGKSAALENYDFADQPARYIRIVGYGNTQSAWNSITETRLQWSNLPAGFHTANNNKLIFYPNPLNGNVLNIQLPENMNGNNNLVINDIVGRNVYTQELENATSKTENIKLQLTSGIYLVLLKNKNIIFSGTLLVK